ncbi:MAG: four helix bundle protein, partial [Acidobacteria bacterium]|nr:four helix bundle protein [Acidobacteriota bacterium]
CARDHHRERVQFLNTARSSLAEVGYCLHVARRLDYIDEKTFDTFDVLLRQTAAALTSIIREGADFVHVPRDPIARTRSDGLGCETEADARRRRRLIG